MTTENRLFWSVFKDDAINFKIQFWQQSGGSSPPPATILSVLQSMRVFATDPGTARSSIANTKPVQTSW